MLLNDAASADSVELVPISYEFQALHEDKYDANWLIIRGNVRAGRDRWTFVDPVLLVWEAHKLEAWLRQVVSDEVEVASPDDHGELFTQVWFVEPNLGMAVIAKSTDDVTIRFFFSHESGLPNLVSDIEMSRADATVDLTLTRSSVARAANEWLEELQRFPARAASAP